MLIAARFVQGVGGAMASAVILGMIVTHVPASRASRRRRSAIYSFVASAGASIGLLAGGVLTQALSWHWIFFVNVPIGIATGVLALRLLAPERGAGLRAGRRRPRRVLVTAALMLGVYTIVAGGRQRLGLAPDARARRRRASRCWPASSPARRPPRNPLLPLRILRSRDRRRARTPSRC